MTDEQKYAEVIKEFGELLERKNGRINLQEYQIENLQNKLKAVEKHLDELTQE